MGTKLYVGNIAFHTMEPDLRGLFEQAGTVTSCDVIIDRMSGRSRGFGFVEMGSDEEASKAVEMFNGQDLDGRPLVVNEARPKTDRGGDRGGGGGGGGGYRGGGGGGGGGRGGDRGGRGGGGGGRDRGGW